MAPSQMGHKQKEALQKSAVAISFWIGSCGLILMKGIAYAISGSSLVRAAMFESIGDAFASLILWVAQARVADSSNRHKYPAGKRRISPLGVLFFSAFALSAMTGIALESLQGLFAEEETQQPEVASAAALQRLFEEKPRLRLLLHPRRNQLEEVIAEYSGGKTVANIDVQPAEPGMLGALGALSESSRLVLLLLCICIVIKLVCLVWCSRVARRANSEIARTLAADHYYDVICTTFVVAVMLFVAWAETRGIGGAWMGKVDPAGSLLLSLYVAYNWLCSAMEQVVVLSNHRVTTEASDAIAGAARRNLEAGMLEFCDLHAYHAGEGCAAELHVQLRPGQKNSAAGAELAKAIAAVEQAVLEADCDVSEVHTRLQTRSPS